MLNKEMIQNIYARLMIANNGLSAHDMTEHVGTQNRHEKDMTYIERIAQNSPSATLSQLTLITQFEQMMYAHAPSTRLTRLTTLPPLNTPVLPVHLHRLVGQILDDHKDEVMWTVRVLMFIFERGYTVPPTVWLPPRNIQTDFDDPDELSFEGEFPSEYLAWCTWVNEGKTQTQSGVLTDDNWEEWHPTQRLSLLKKQRKSDPKAARELIVKLAPKEIAEKRLKLVETLAVNLSDEDKPFLRSLKKDRSQKVKDIAKDYLARLGEYDDDDAIMADELFGELTMGVGGIIFTPTKNNKQQENRQDLLQKVNLFALAKKFNLSLTEFLLAWDFDGNERRAGYHDYNYLLFSRVIKMMDDEALRRIAKPLLKIIEKQNAHYYTLIRPRLPLSIRQDFAYKKFLKKEDFSDLLCIMPRTLDLGFGALQVSGSYRQLIENIHHWQKKHSDYLDDHYLIGQIHALGLLISQDAAKECLAHLEQLGIMKTDAALSVLTLNALLDNRA